jgi:hypothetical protein
MTTPPLDGNNEPRWLPDDKLSWQRRPLDDKLLLNGNNEQRQPPDDNLSSGSRRRSLSWTTIVRIHAMTMMWK